MTTERRHPNVVNVDELEAMTREKGSKFGWSAKRLGMAAGARGIGCGLYEQPPGRTAFPRHYHANNEEALFVLEGTGEVQIGDDVVAIRAGDWVTFPVGPEHAHRVTNTGETTLRYLCMSTMQPVDVVGYPESNKIGVFAGAPGSTWTDPPWARGFHRSDAEVDYYDGEDVD